jgi:hypothetical protein
MALVCQEVLAAHVIDPLDPAGYKQHQKLIVGEATPANAYWIMSTLRALQIDARILHAGLFNKAKADMVDLFDDPISTLRVLIMMRHRTRTILTRSICSTFHELSPALMTRHDVRHDVSHDVTRLSILILEHKRRNMTTKIIARVVSPTTFCSTLICRSMH